MKTKIAVLIDFDGTITKEDVTMRIYGKFAKPTCAKLNQMWAEGKVSTIQELEGCFATITTSRREIEENIRDIQFDSGFKELVELCREESLPIAILSDGLDWYIQYLLDTHGFADISIYANHIEFTAEGYRFRYPWFDPKTPMRGISKSAIIQKFQSEGYQVIFIGDGLTDTDAAKAADILFAKEALFEYCTARSIPSVKYNTLDDILKVLKSKILFPASQSIELGVMPGESPEN